MKKSVKEGEMDKLATSFIESLSKMGKQALVIGLYGNLGSGKTTFVKEVARSLGVKDYVISPTFIIMKSYKLHNKRYRLLIHIDAYRLDNSEELLKLGFRDLIKDPKNLVLVEWADRVEEILPKDSIKIYFKHVDENTREVTFY